jgi:hypothetical protein
MEKYYFIRVDDSKIGVPALLEGGIYEQFIEKKTYIENYVFPPSPTVTPAWDRKITMENPVQMPEKLFLINKHRKIDFDMYQKEGGFIVSDKFKKIIDINNHPKYISTRLEVRTREGECNTKKEYWYIKFIERSPCIDFSKSEVKLFNNNSKEEQPAIYKYLNKVVLNSKYFIPKELFWIDNSRVNAFIFCNNEIVESIIKSKIKTVIITEIESLFDYFYSVGWVNQRTKLIIE